MAALRGNASAIDALVILVGLAAWLLIKDQEKELTDELTAVGTLAAVWATWCFMKDQTDRAKRAQSTELFCNCGNVRSVPTMPLGDAE